MRIATLLRRNVLASLGVIVCGAAMCVPPASAGPVPALRQLMAAAPAPSGGVVVDHAGDVFLTAPYADAVYVLPAATGTIFGQPVTKGVEVALTAATGLDGPAGLAIDVAGDLFISNAGYADDITVLPAATGTVFGQSVTANQAVTLTAAQGIITPMGLAFDSAGDLFVASQSLNEVAVIPATDTTLFGQSAPADETTLLTASHVQSVVGPTGIALDSAGDLFIASDLAVVALPAVTGTLYGQSVTADEAVVLTGSSQVAATLGEINDVAVNAGGDLFITGTAKHRESTELGVLAGPTTTSVFGQAISPGSAAVLGVGAINGGQVLGIATDDAGDVVSAAEIFGSGILASSAIAVLAAADGSFCGTSVTANSQTLIPSGFPYTPVPGGYSHVAVDDRGDAFVTAPENGGVLVVPAADGVLFGQAVERGRPALLTATVPATVQGIAIDGSGDLFVTEGKAQRVAVLTSTTTQLFGQTITADSLTPLTALRGTTGTEGLAVDASGNLFGTTASGVWVLPTRSSVIFGVGVRRNRPTTLLSSTSLGGPIAIDGAQHLFLAVDHESDPIPREVWLLAADSGTVLGQSVSADTFTHLTGMDALPDQAFDGLAVTSSGDLVGSEFKYGPSGTDGTLVVDFATSGTRWGTSVVAGTATPLSESADHSGYLDVAMTPGDSIDALSMTGLWTLGGTVVFETPTTAAAQIGHAASIPVDTIGGLGVPTLSASGLPSGLSLVDDGDGTATIVGTPIDGTPKSVTVTITAQDPAAEPVTEWLTVTVAANDTLRPGASFGAGDPLRSRSGVYELKLTARGNLVLLTAGGRHLWSSHTKGSGATKVVYSHRGVLKLVDAGGHRVFARGRPQADPQRLRLLDSGDLVARAGGQVTWHTRTAQPLLCDANPAAAPAVTSRCG